MKALIVCAAAIAKALSESLPLAMARAVVVGALAIASLLAIPALALEHIVFLLPAPPQLPAFAPMMIAKEQGYYADAGYDVEFIAAKGGIDVAKQVGVGNAPVGAALGDAPMIVKANGVPVKSVALLGGGALGVIVARPGRGIDKIEDLRGKKVAVMSFQEANYLALLGALATKGLSKNEVDIQAVGPGGVTSFVISGTVDACVCTPDWEIDVRNAVPGTKSIPLAEVFPGMAQAILASDNTIATRPDLVRGVVKATLKGMRTVMDDPAAAAKIYTKALPAFAGKEELMTQILRNFAERTYNGQKVLGETDPDRLAKLQKFYIDVGFIPSAVPLEQLYTNEFVK
jgi:NitT/TauT family transport system substrate-binding protein